MREKAVDNTVDEVEVEVGVIVVVVVGRVDGLGFAREEEEVKARE